MNYLVTNEQRFFLRKKPLIIENILYVITHGSKGDGLCDI
jgi:hypothetical protein